MKTTLVSIAVALALVAFLFFGSLMLGTGSLGSNMREAQQLAMIPSMLIVSGMAVYPAVMNSPNGPVAVFVMDVRSQRRCEGRASAEQCFEAGAEREIHQILVDHGVLVLFDRRADSL